jgi:hypothetical protein
MCSGIATGHGGTYPPYFGQTRSCDSHKSEKKFRGSGVARICIWRGLGARSATGTAGGAKGAGGRAGVGPGAGEPPPGRGFGGITSEKILEI